MRHFKIVENGYISFIGIGELTGETISQEEFNILESIVLNRPADTETHYYKLRADTLEYEAIERPEPIILHEPAYTLDEAATLLAQEVSQ